MWATPELLAESGSALYSYTSMGPVRINHGDWCVLGDKEIYPCPHEEFLNRYEEVTEPVMRIQTTTPPPATEEFVSVLIKDK